MATAFALNLLIPLVYAELYRIGPRRLEPAPAKQTPLSPQPPSTPSPLLPFARLGDCNPGIIKLMGSGSNDAVLLVIDEDRVRKVASSTLQKAGFRVFEARTMALESLAQVQDQADDIGLAIVDADASRQEASELLRDIHRILPDSRVLLLSESAEMASLACRGQRGCWFMRKPFRRARFLGQVLEVVGEPGVLTA